VSAIFLDSFSGAAADLKKGQRSAENVLAVLAKSPRVSTWDMEAAWLRGALAQLQRDGLISEDKSEPYPWHRYTVTAAGRAALEAAS
jgi:DNA-binding HxlR family transcriptional regulator